MTIICKKYPQLRVYDLNLAFEKGQVETDSPDVVERLKQMSGFEFEFIGEVIRPNENPLFTLTIEALKALAEQRKVDIGNATSVNGIAKKLIEAGVVYDGGNG